MSFEVRSLHFSRFAFIILFYTSFLIFLAIYVVFGFLSVFPTFNVILYSVSFMASHRRSLEMTSPRSLEPIQGIALQGPLSTLLTSKWSAFIVKSRVTVIMHLSIIDTSRLSGPSIP